MTKITKKTTLLTLILTFFLAIGAIFALVPAKKNVTARAASTTISQLSISSMSKPAQIYVKVGSNNVPTTVVNWIWTGEIVDGKKTLSEFGKDAISGAASIYGYQSNYFIVEPNAEPTEGTKIVIPGNKIFTVDGMDYVFDQNYTFTYSGSKWSVAGTPAVVEATVISDVLQGEWCASTSTANQLRLNAASLNVPTTVVNWNSQLGIAGVGSMYGGGNDWFAMDLSPAATAGTKIAIPGNKEFTVAGKAYKFDQDYNFWYNGTGWQTTEYVTTTVISGVTQGEWCASTSSASQLRLNATSKNVPTTIVNWNKQLGITGVSSMYGAGDVTWFAMDISPAATAGTKITIPGNKIFTVDGTDYTFDQDYSFWYNGAGWQSTEYVVSVATVISGLTHSDWCASTSTASQIRVSVASENLPAKIENWNKQLGIAGVTSMYNGGDGKWLAMDLSPAATAGTKITIPGNKEFTVDGQAYKFDKDYSFWYNGTGWQTTEYVPATETFLTFKGIGSTNAQNGVVIEFNETVPAEVGTVGNLSYASGTLGKNATWQESEDGAVNKFNAASSTGVLMSGNGIVMYPPSGLSKAGAKIVIPAGTTLIESATNIVTISETITLWFDGTAWSTNEYVPTVTTNLTFKGIGATNAQNGVVIEFNETVPAEVGTVGNLSYASGTLGKNATWQASADGAVNKFNAASSTGVLMSGNGIVMYPPNGLSQAGAKIVIPAGTTLIESAANIVVIKNTITLWFDGATWSTTEYVPVAITSMTLGDVKTADSIPNTLYVRATGVPVQVVNWIWGIPESATFRSSITLTGTDKAVAELSIYSENDGILIITGLNAVDGTYIKISGGVLITVNGTKCQFDQDYEFTYLAGKWHVGQKYAVTQVIGEESRIVAAGAEYTLPVVSTEKGLAFGWLYNGTTYAVGETIALNGNATIEAQTIGFVQQNGAAIRLSGSADESGIRFTCFLSAEDFAKYEDIIVSIGIEVQPLDLMNPDHTVNEEKNPVKFSLSGADLKVVSNVEFGEGVLLRGTIKKMYTHNYKRPIAARSYIELMINGEARKFYVDFDKEQHVRTISEVAEAYKEDKQIVGNEVLNAYIGASDLLTYGYFSPVATKENYEAYKAAGFNTLWLDTFSDQYCYFEPFQTVEEALAAAKTFADAGNKYTTKKNMDLALEAGIKQVLIYDARIRLLTQCDVALVSDSTAPIGIFTEEGHLMGSQIVSSKLNLSANTYNGKAIADILYPFASREALKEYIAACLASYMDHEAFYGVFLVDEPKTKMYEQVGLVKQIIKEICPDAYTQCPQLPPTSSISAWENSLRAYLDACGGVGNVDEFSYDFYPYTNDTNWWESLWGNESFTIVPTYIQAMQVAANLANEYGCIWELAFQTYANEHYMELNEARVFWQTNLATAFGVDRLSAYTYAGTSADGPTQYIENDANLKAWVKTALGYAEHAREALAHYSYNASQTYTASEDFVKNVTKEAFSGNVFTSISSTDDLLVNEFVYEGGSKYAYAFVNCTNVIDGNTQITVTVNLAQATTLKFVYNGATVEKTFAAGANTFTLNAGEMAIIK